MDREANDDQGPHKDGGYQTRSHPSARATQTEKRLALTEDRDPDNVELGHGERGPGHHEERES